MPDVIKSKNKKERGGLLIFILLWLGIRGIIAVGFLPAHIYQLYAENGAYRNLEMGFSILALILNALQVVGVFGMVRWKRWGLVMLIFILVINGILDWATGSIMSMFQNITICAALIWIMKDKGHYLE